MALLELTNVHTYYGNIHALKGISLKVEDGEIVTLIGSNGAGKTTTLRTISGLLAPREGKITLAGKDIHGLPAH
jgi:branched-chain amino acid transport system ATP-binding protein